MGAARLQPVRYARAAAGVEPGGHLWPVGSGRVPVGRARASVRARHASVTRQRSPRPPCSWRCRSRAPPGVRGASRARRCCEGPAVRVALVQGNVPQGQKWDPAYRDAILSRYLSLTRERGATGRRSRGLAGVVDAVRVRPRWHPDRGDARRGASGRACRSCSAATRSSGPTEFYNSAFVMDATGEIRGSYRKMQLVPFGEYIPVRTAAVLRPAARRGLLGLQRRPATDAAARRWPPDVGGGVLRGGVSLAGAPRRAAGEPVARDDHQRRVVRPLCRALPALPAGAGPRRGDGPVPRARRQHRHQRRGRPVWPRAVVQSPLFETGTWMGEVRWLDGTTPYVRTGDAVAWACMLVVVALLALPMVERIRR